MHPMTPVSQRGRGGRILWRACGIAVCAALGAGALNYALRHSTAPFPQQFITVTRTVTVAQPVTSLTVRLPGTQVQVIARPRKDVQVTSSVMYDPKLGGPLFETRAVSGGRLTLSCPGEGQCGQYTTVAIPPDVAVTVISGGATVSADGLHGPLTASTQGGDLHVSDLTGPLYADTEAGAVSARGLRSQTVIVSAGGGDVQIGFARPPRTVVVSSWGNPVTLTVPGGPYAVNALAAQSGVSVRVPISPGAPRTLTLTSDNGPVTVEPAR
jgi:hypothetical protein